MKSFKRQTKGCLKGLIHSTQDWRS